jgi:hypothetical protein
MVAPPPTVADLQALILTLQAQVVILQATILASPATAVAICAVTPQMLNVKEHLDYLTKRGSSIYEKGCKALDDMALMDSFGMATDQTMVFVKAFSCCTTAMGWNKGTKQITTFANQPGTLVYLINRYGQIDEAAMKTDCKRFYKSGEVDAQSHATQNNTMMAICLASSLTTEGEGQAWLLTYRNENTFDGVEYAPLIFKIIMRLATIDSIATTQTLCKNACSNG